MKNLLFKVISTGSKGNSYILEAENRTLLIEAGVKFKTLFPLLPIDKYPRYILISHKHGDHYKYISDYTYRGIKEIYGQTLIDGFEVKPFRLVHDIDCYGYYIRSDNHYLAYITDTFDVNIYFKQLNTLIIEASYDDDMIDNQYFNNQINLYLYRRIKENHLSTKKGLYYIKQQQNICPLDNIIFVHLSESRNAADKLIKMSSRITSANIYVAKPNEIIKLNII